MTDNNQAVLASLLKDLRADLQTLESAPFIPELVKRPVRTSFQILDILISEVRHDG